MNKIPVKDIPAGPRLEFRWTDIPKPTANTTGIHYVIPVRMCEYLLVLPSGGYGDIRLVPGESDEVIVYKLTETVEEASTYVPSDKSDEQNWHAPFRDGVHAQWDTRHLGNLPIWVTYAGLAVQQV